jgi:cytosolic carboxypeptidase protein 6
MTTGCSDKQVTTKGLPYDPEGSTITTDKEITPHHKRTFFFSGSGLYVSNEFTGSRLNDFFRVNDTLYHAVIKPENAPVNNSPWFAFKIWSESPQKITIKLIYENGKHRYHPKISSDGINWKPLSEERYINLLQEESAILNLDVDKDTIWISAQELLTSNHYENWFNNLSQKSFINKTSIGESNLGKDIYKVEINESEPDADYIILLGRLHPPEVTGAIAMEEFISEIVSESDLAKNFRKKFKVFAFPLVNPDGVDEGHWRHNGTGVDLNRDWVNFNQPEPKHVSEVIKKIVKNSSGKLKFYIDFHSTQTDVFYINPKDPLLENDPAYNSLMVWLEKIKENNPDYLVNIDDQLNNPQSPASDSWASREFKVPAVTYEVGDETDRYLIKKIASSAAKSLMQLMLDEKI